MPTFNQKILNNFVPIFSEQADVLVEKLKPFVGQGCIDVFPLLRCCSLDTVCGKLWKILSTMKKCIFFPN